MTLNQTFQEYEIITDEPGADFVIEHLPTGNRFTVNKGDVSSVGSVSATGNIDTTGVYQVDGTQVVNNRQSAVGSLTDNTGGTTDGTLAAVSGSGADTAINNNFAELNAKLDAILTALGTGGHGLTGD